MVKYAVFRSAKTGELYGLTLEEDEPEMTVEDYKTVLEVLDLHQKQLDNLAKLFNLQQQQITLLGSVHTAEPSNVIDAETGLKKLHEEACKLPEGASKTGEGEDEHGTD